MDKSSLSGPFEPLGARPKCPMDKSALLETNLVFAAISLKSTLNSSRVASPLVRLVGGEERWEAPDQP
ncbi:hypothetical protein TNCV_3837411 [Trichonephila clavipes]|nr:hypothetical protein TNCV_3837411 [Trichonephila clavipes]